MEGRPGWGGVRKKVAGSFPQLPGGMSDSCHMGHTACRTHPVTLFLKLGWKFYDADDYHPEENRIKMGKGIPLNDQVTFATGGDLAAPGVGEFLGRGEWLGRG